MQVSTDRLVSLNAMFIGLATPFIVVYQTQLQRAAQTASVLPYLMIALQSNSESTFGDRWRVTSDRIVPDEL